MWVEARYTIQVVDGTENIIKFIEGCMENPSQSFSASLPYFSNAVLSDWDFQNSVLIAFSARHFEDRGDFFTNMTPLYSENTSNTFELIKDSDNERTGVFCKLIGIEGKTESFNTVTTFTWVGSKDGTSHTFNRKLIFKG